MRQKVSEFVKSSFVTLNENRISILHEQSAHFVQLGDLRNKVMPMLKSAFKQIHKKYQKEIPAHRVSSYEQTDRQVAYRTLERN